MADWVHCNQCFRKPGSEHTFYLTSCGHIYCDDCVKEGTKNQCHICGVPCSTIELSSKMKPEVEIFFEDPREIAKKQHRQLLQVMDFQKNHRQRFEAHKKEQEAKTQSQMAMTMRNLQKAMDLEREVRHLREENCKLRRLMSGSPGPGGAAKAYRPSTPGRVLANSSIPPNMRNMVHQNSSHSISRSSSPYGRPQHMQQMDTCKTSQSQPMTPTRTPPGPARLSIRTPPVNGRIGTVGTPTPGHMTLTPSGTLIRSANTPGGVVDMATTGHTSPMNISPASNRSFVSLSGIRSSQHRDGSSQGNRTPGLSQSSQTDPSRRPIQLNYTPTRPVISSTPGSQYRQGKS
ncbi:probable E3 SUMO-protein ligase RNF212 isoform X2 [Patiria miniata]|uniref:RING-type domain-containing protein n=1 Tax=Patiria miniata TaxID=46514 RepID=A0A914B281_PATMI|nr:probable E3 SUMO-protein ligase RNF212 isoform X2 [Patiria miniata]